MSTITLHDSVHDIDANDANLSFSKFEDVRMEGSTFSEVAFADSTFRNVRLDGSSFHRVSLVNVKITEARCEGMTIDGVDVNTLLEVYRATRAGAAKQG